MFMATAANEQTEITPTLSFSKFEETVTYFHCDMPIFTHEATDRASFLVAVAQLHVTCGAKQAAIARAFGVPQITIKRAVKLFRAGGAPAFYAPRVRRGAVVLTDAVLEQAQSQLDQGQEASMVAEQLRKSAPASRRNPHGVALAKAKYVRPKRPRGLHANASKAWR
jgi:transposase-like protein